jgi:hypothetical protein
VPNSVLYFPHIEIHNEEWLKRALLLWDFVYRIVPNGYTPRDNDETKLAVDVGLLRPICVDNHDLLGLKRTFLDFLESLPFTPAGLVAEPRELLHLGKIDASLYPLLEQYSTNVSDDGWIDLPREIVRGYMFFLSSQIAKRRKLDRGTDNPEAFSVAAYFSERGNFEESMYDPDAQGFYNSLFLGGIMPTSLAGVPMKKVIDIVAKTGDEKAVFRSELETFITQLRSIQDKAHAQLVIEDFRNKLLSAKEELRKSQGFLSKDDIGSLLTVGVPTALGAYCVLPNAADPFQVTRIAGSVLIGAISAYANYRKVAREKRPIAPAYLLALDTRFDNWARFPAFDRYFEEFLND